MAYVMKTPNALFAGLGEMDLSDYQISLGARGKNFAETPRLSAADILQPSFIGESGIYKVPSSVRKIGRPVKVNFRYGVPSVAGFGVGDSTDAGTAIAIGTAGLVISAVVSFGLMIGAAYVGARWAGCRRA